MQKERILKSTIVNNSGFQVLYVSNIKDTRDFYMNIGASIVEFEDSLKVVVNLAGTDLHFIYEDNEPFELYKDFTRKPKYSHRGHGILTYFEVENIKKHYEFIWDYHIDIRSSIQENHWGFREFAFSDPDGYILIAYGK